MGTIQSALNRLLQTNFAKKIGTTYIKEADEAEALRDLELEHLIEESKRPENDPDYQEQQFKKEQEALNRPVSELVRESDKWFGELPSQARDAKEVSKRLYDTLTGRIAQLQNTKEGTSERKEILSKRQRMKEYGFTNKQINKYYDRGIKF